MPAQRIDGKAIGAAVRAEIKERVGEFSSHTGITPCLVTVLVGEDPASRVYVRNKGKACTEAGMLS
ncbi:MAG: bifunctional 5,10-methylene-tetrahydrofolate dehydrogenase/5,10-methylene-tetrahydrofolate cyclohydrolase, partial [Deltaproteobacteria bacterium]|nr:bifunctional 5,10-methylene-tetrahydrofolate dehydrogenase/5,10-methylene-tetrahydrofolate cyclohydrolase [Deltaproteobacteria bacterium]